jgi:hypothetical protein
VKAKIINACVALVLLVGCGSSAEARGPDECSPAKPCGGDGKQYPDYGYSVVHVNVDGRRVTCVAVRLSAAGASISCDWSPS